jgi:hypothetical protein
MLRFPLKIRGARGVMKERLLIFKMELVEKLNYRGQTYG